MSTRVQKGSTVFRPVVKSRPRPTESVLVSDNRTSHPLESHDVSLSGALGSAPAAVISQAYTVFPQASPQGCTDHAVPAAIANTTKQGVPTVISSAPTARSLKSSPLHATEETSAVAGPSNTEVSIVEQTPQSKRRSRSKSLASAFPKKSRKFRRPATPAFDPDAGPGEDLDSTSVTMAALCEDTGQGRISSKATQILDGHLAWKKSNREKRARMRMRMEAKKYGRNDDNDAVQMSHPESELEQIPIDAPSGSPSVQPDSGNPASIGDVSGQGFDYSQSISTSRYSVQVRIGPSGETIVDEESLFVDRSAEEDTAEYTHVEESDVTKFINSATYSKRFRGSRWSAQETESFYDALSQFGENYELISYVLPGRDRKACKNKFKSEDKKNPQRINYCLKNRRPYDMQALSRMTGKDFSGPIPEIRAPVVLSLGEPQNNPKGEPSVSRHTNSSPIIDEHDTEEVVGDISSFAE